MNISIYFLLAIILFLLVIEVITVLFKLTGLSEDKARFQVISLLTGCGFTTKEADLITQHPTRRKLAQVIMVLGYLGFITGISFLIKLLKSSFAIEDITIILIASLIILVLIKNKFFLSNLDTIIENIVLKKYFRKKSSTKIYKLINRAKGYGIYNIIIEDDCTLIGVSLKDSNLKPHNMLILNIDKGDKFIGFPKRDYIIEKGDNILIYGKVEEVIKTFGLENKKTK